MGGNNMSALFTPIRTGDTELLKEVLERYGPVVPLLLQKQFIANADGCLEPDPVFTTPLKFCIGCNEPECLRMLLEAGGDPNEGGKGGATLLHKACKKMSMECVKILLEFGARIYDCDEWGVYPIHVCVGAYGDFEESLKILDILLEAGNAEDIHLKDGETQKLPLHYAAQYGNKNMCKKLLELGADINAKDKYGRSAYQNCERQPKCRDFLKESGCEIPEPPKKKPLPPLFPVVRNSVSSNDGASPAPPTPPDSGNALQDGDTVTVTTTVEVNESPQKHDPENAPMLVDNNEP